MLPPAVTFDGCELYRGLAALHWAALDFSDPGKDFPYFRQRVQEGNGPALDVGCGTGRILLPLLAEGFDVHGVDPSEEMLAACRERAASFGVTPSLYCQPVQRLQPPSRYATIFIPCGTFVLIVDRTEALHALRRLRALLLPAGSLVFNLFLPWFDLPAFPLPPDPPWQLRGDCPVHHPQGDRLVVHRRPVHVDPAAQRLTEQRRYQLYSNGRLAREELRFGQETWYSPSEINLLLKLAGFSRVHLTGDYTEEPLSGSHREVMVVQAW